MAFADDITLRDAAAADKTFARRTTGADSADWIDTASSAAQPRTMRIAHRREPIKGRPGEYQDRHTVTFSVTEKETQTNVPYTGSMSVSIVLPQVGPVERGDIDHLNSFLKSATNGFLTTSANIDKLCLGQL